jgi:hypothetical protein
MSFLTDQKQICTKNKHICYFHNICKLKRVPTKAGAEPLPSLHKPGTAMPSMSVLFSLLFLLAKANAGMG